MRETDENLLETMSCKVSHENSSVAVGKSVAASIRREVYIIVQVHTEGKKLFKNTKYLLTGINNVFA